MARTPSNMLPLGTIAPSFDLPNTVDGCNINSESFTGQPLFVAFICNHCPFVVHIQAEFTALANELVDRGVAVVAISANDVADYPDDSPEKMAALAKQEGYRFAYLYDESQAVARAYDAACTPDFYLFNGEHRLVYRGQFDASRPGNDILVSGDDLRAAAEALLAGQDIPTEQTPSIGCNIKWKSKT